MTRMSIVSLGIALGICGTAMVASAEKPTEDITVVQYTSIWASLFAFDIGGSCVTAELIAFVSSDILHSTGKGEPASAFGYAEAHFLLWDPPNGILYQIPPEVFVDDLDMVTGGMQSVVAAYEIPAFKWQCKKTDDCSAGWENCVFLGTETLSLDLTWNPDNSVDNENANGTIHTPEWFLLHDMIHYKARNASVEGLASIGGYDLEIIDQSGFYTLINGMNNSIPGDCEGEECCPECAP